VGNGSEIEATLKNIAPNLPQHFLEYSVMEKTWITPSIVHLYHICTPNILDTSVPEEILYKSPIKYEKQTIGKLQSYVGMF